MGMLITEFEVVVVGKYGDVERTELCPSDLYAKDRVKYWESQGKQAIPNVKITDYNKMEIRRYRID